MTSAQCANFSSYFISFPFLFNLQSGSPSVVALEASRGADNGTRTCYGGAQKWGPVVARWGINGCIGLYV